VRVYSSELWAFDMQRSVWRHLGGGSSSSNNNLTAPAWPPARAHFAFGVILSQDTNNPYLIVFSGDSSGGLLDDLWAYSISSNKWTQLSTTADTPMPRRSPAAVSLSDPSYKLLIYGGFSYDPAAPITFHRLHFLVLRDQAPSQPSSGFLAGVPPYPQWERINVSLPVDPSCMSNYSAVAATPSGVVYSFGGQSNQSVILDTLCIISLGCPAGWYSLDFSRLPCEPCPIGFYSSQPAATSCQKCTPSTTTTSLGSLNASACSVCSDWAKSKLCHNFPCSINQAGSVVCHCSGLYRGPFCEDTTLLQAAIITPVVVFLVLVVLAVLYGFRRANRRLSKERDLKVSLLEKMSIRMHELVDVFTIKPEDLNMQTTPIGHGSFCQVA
jgi:hypothetical protein